MTREEAKEKLELIKAYAEGKTIQIMSYSGDWKDLENPDFSHALQDYRIKPEEEYRPYKDCHEMIADFKERSNTTTMPLIWVHIKDMSNKVLITGFQNGGVYIYNEWESLDDLFKGYTYLDDTPCGVKE